MVTVRGEARQKCNSRPPITREGAPLPVTSVPQFEYHGIVLRLEGPRVQKQAKGCRLERFVPCQLSQAQLLELRTSLGFTATRLVLP